MFVRRNFKTQPTMVQTRAMKRPHTASVSSTTPEAKESKGALKKTKMEKVASVKSRKPVRDGGKKKKTEEKKGAKNEEKNKKINTKEHKKEDDLPPSELRYNGSAKAPIQYIFAHGAGAGMDHEYMESVASKLGGQDIQVVRFEFPYMVKRRVLGSRSPPNRQPKLVESFLHELERIPRDGKVRFIGGKSMGGRIASHVAVEMCDSADVSGLVCLGFPFYGPKTPRQPESSRGAHLAEVDAPTLIIQGDRDSFASQSEVEKMPFPSTVECVFIPDGDHGLKPRVKSGYTLEENITTAVEAMRSFMLKHSNLP